MSLKPPQPRYHRLLIILFLFLGIGGIIIGICQQYQNNLTSEQLMAKIINIDKTAAEIATNIKNFKPKETEISKTIISSLKIKKEPEIPEKSKVTEKESIKDIEKGITDLKRMIAGQTWGLNAEQLIKLSKRMTPFAKTEDRGDLIWCVLGDSDSTKFAVSLVAAFRTAGWQLKGYYGMNQALFPGNPTGIIIILNSKDANPAGVRELIITLRESGIEPTEEIDTDIPPNHFRIIVGRKP